jgi:cytochrome c-type biogenesis protein CcmF
VVLLAIGIAGSSAYQTVRERGLKVGQSLELAGYTLRYDGLETRKTANAVETRAVVSATRGGSRIGTLHPGKNFYPVAPGGPQTSNEVSIYHDPRNLGDLFLIADQIDKNGTLYLKVLVKPLVNLVWAAGFLFLFGSLVALWPDAVEQRRLAERYAAAPA